MKKSLIILSATLVFSMFSVNGANAESTSVKDSYQEIPNFEQLSEELDVPVDVLKERYNLYKDKTPDEVISKGQESFSNTNADGKASIAASYTRTWNNSYKDTSFWTCQYRVSTSTSANKTIDTIEARARLYNDKGVLRGSSTDTQSKSKHAGTSASGYIIASNVLGFGCKGTGYSNNVWKNKGNENFYRETKFNIKELV